MMMVDRYIEETKQQAGDESVEETPLTVDEALNHPDPRDPVRLREKDIGAGSTVFIGSGEPAPLDGLYQTEAPSIREVEMKAGETLPYLDGHGQLWRLHEEFVTGDRSLPVPDDVVADADGE